MNDNKTSGISLFWGIVLSLSLHGIIILLAIFWGFGTPNYSAEPDFIEGRLVSLSEIEQPGRREIPRKEEIKASQPEKKEIPEEPKKVEVKKEEPPMVKEEQPEEEIKAPQIEKKEVLKEPKKEEPQKAEVKKEEPPRVKEEQPKKDVVVLDTKKEEKKQVAQKPTEPPKATPPKETKKKKEPTFEEIRQRVIKEMQKDVVLKDIQKNVEEKEVAEADSDSLEEKAEIQKDSDHPTEQSDNRSRGVLTRLFVNRVREEIKDHWGIPPNIPMDGSLNVVIVFKIDQNGKVYDVNTDKPSGNPAFDDFCIKAIYKAAPLTPPPSELLEEARTDGLEITFTNSPS